MLSSILTHIFPPYLPSFTHLGKGLASWSYGGGTRSRTGECKPGLAETKCGIANPNGGGCAEISDTTCDGDGTENEACSTDACPEDCSVGKVSGLIFFFVLYLLLYVVLSCVKLVYVKRPLSQLKPNSVVGQLGVTVRLLVVEEKELEQENVSLVQILQVLVQVMALKEKHVIQMLVKIVALVRLVCSIAWS